MSLPFDKMYSLCSKSSLCVTDEGELVTLFTKYLAHRDALPLLAEEDPMRDWELNGMNMDAKHAELIRKVLLPEEMTKKLEEKKKEEEDAKTA